MNVNWVHTTVQQKQTAPIQLGATPVPARLGTLETAHHAMVQTVLEILTLYICDGIFLTQISMSV